MTKPPASPYLAECIERSGKSNVEIAALVGFERGNVVAMLKTTMQLPLEKVVPMADALGIDRAKMFRETRPKEWAVLEQVFSDPKRRALLVTP